MVDAKIECAVVYKQERKIWSPDFDIQTILQQSQQKGENLFNTFQQWVAHSFQIDQNTNNISIYFIQDEFDIDNKSFQIASNDDFALIFGKIQTNAKAIANNKNGKDNTSTAHFLITTDISYHIMIDISQISEKKESQNIELHLIDDEPSWFQLLSSISVSLMDSLWQEQYVLFHKYSNKLIKSKNDFISQLHDHSIKGSITFFLKVTFIYI